MTSFFIGSPRGEGLAASRGLARFVPPERESCQDNGATFERRKDLMRIIGHVDMDAFYAAVEARYNPDLRDKPVVVGADPKGGKGRGVVTAANYAARRYGIRSATPISRAWKLAEGARRRGEPETIFVRDNRKLYGEVSERIMALLARSADAFEEANIDAA